MVGFLETYCSNWTESATANRAVPTPAPAAAVAPAAEPLAPANAMALDVPAPATDVTTDTSTAATQVASTEAAEAAAPPTPEEAKAALMAQLLRRVRETIFDCASLTSLDWDAPWPADGAATLLGPDWTRKLQRLVTLSFLLVRERHRTASAARSGG